MDDDSDTEVEVKQESYWKLFKHQGGLGMLVLSHGLVCIHAFLERQKEYGVTSYSAGTAQEQQDGQVEFMQMMMKNLLFLFAFNTIH
jgi:preprotein translocase subunit SecG